MREMENQKSEKQILESSSKKFCTNTIIYNGKIYYIHPVYNQYCVRKSGKVFNCETMNQIIGSKRYNGYVKVTLKIDNKKQKTIMAHRFIYECFYGIIPNGKVIDHINDIKDDNRIKNLQIMTQQKKLFEIS